MRAVIRIAWFCLCVGIGLGLAVAVASNIEQNRSSDRSADSPDLPLIAANAGPQVTTLNPDVSEPTKVAQASVPQAIDSPKVTANQPATVERLPQPVPTPTLKHKLELVAAAEDVRTDARYHSVPSERQQIQFNVVVYKAVPLEMGTASIDFGAVRQKISQLDTSGATSLSAFHSDPSGVKLGFYKGNGRLLLETLRASG